MSWFLKENIFFQNTPALAQSEAGHQKKFNRSYAEVASLKTRVEILARILTTPDLLVAPGKRWYVGISKEARAALRQGGNRRKSKEEFEEGFFDPVVLIYDEEDLKTRSEDYIFGILRREIAHCKHSDFRLINEKKELVKKEKLRVSDLYVIYRAWEEGRSLTLEANEPSLAGYQVEPYLREYLLETLTSNFEDRPAPIQYAILCWAKSTEKFLEGFNVRQLLQRVSDKRVIEAYRKTEPLIDEYVSTVNGKEAFEAILWAKAWPIFKDLIRDYIEDEAAAAFEDEKKKVKPGNKGAPGQGKGGKGEGDDGKGKSQPGEEGEPDAKSGDDSGEEGKGDEKKKSGAKPQDTKPGGKGKDGTKGGKGKPGGDGSDGGGEADTRTWNELSEEEKNGYREAARERLNESGDEFIEEVQSSSSQVEHDRSGDVKDETDSASEGEVATAKSKGKQALERERNKQKGGDGAGASRNPKVVRDFVPDRITNMSPELAAIYYASLFHDVSPFVDSIVDVLDVVFDQEARTSWLGKQKEGDQLDQKGLHKVATGEGDMFERRNDYEQKKLAFSLILDISGSMGEKRKLHEAIKSLILVAEALAARDVEFEIIAFNDSIFVVKDFNEFYTDETRWKLIQLFTYCGGGTNDSAAMEFAGRRLLERAAQEDRQGAMIVVTDGISPDPRRVQALSDELGSDFPIIGVGIGEGVESVQQTFGQGAVVVPKIEELPVELATVLSREIMKVIPKQS